jgi:phosphatidylglycerophosphate synthase
VIVLPEQIEPPRSTVEATYKAREVEGVLDLCFYRKIGFRLAQFFAGLGFTPTGVTVLGGICGIIAGHLYFYRDLRINLIGMVLHIFANALDNADGQLARLLNKKSRMGRVIDSLADHLIFLSIYIHLGLRCWLNGASLAIGLLALAAGLSHALQGAAADYFRNAYLYFVKGRSRADWDSSRALRGDYAQVSWRAQPWTKFLLTLQLNFTRQQEMLSPVLKGLRDATEHEFPGGEVPLALRARYGAAAGPMLRWWGLLMTNTRMFFLFLFLAIDRPALYFWLELTAFNILLVFLLIRQERMSSSFLEHSAGSLKAA